MNKRGVLFEVYLVFLTLFMIGMALAIYAHQQGIISAKIVSPVPVMELEDNFSIFEAQEREVAIDTGKSAKNNWNSEAYKQEFSFGFINAVSQNPRMMNFIINDLYHKDQTWPAGTFSGDSGKVLLGEIYQFGFVDGKLKISRTLGKLITLRAYTNDKTFPLQMKYVYAKEYLFNQGDLKQNE